MEAIILMIYLHYSTMKMRNNSKTKQVKKVKKNHKKTFNNKKED